MMTLNRPGTWLFLFASLLSACGGGGSNSNGSGNPNGSENDTTPPQISRIRVSPATATIPYPELGTVKIEVQFSEPVNPRTFAAAITLTNSSDNQQINLLNPSDFETLDTPPRVVVSPKNLTDGQTYDFAIDTDLADLAGNHLKSAYPANALIRTEKTATIRLKVEGLATGSKLTINNSDPIKDKFGNNIGETLVDHNGNFVFASNLLINTPYSLAANATNDAMGNPQFCGIDFYSGAITSDLIIGVSCSTVVPHFAAAPHWDDYAQSANPSLACNANDTSLRGYHSCFHGGEHRVWPLPGNHTCNEIKSINDNIKLPGGKIGAFEWQCESSASGTRVYSTRLKDTARLADLIHMPSSTEDFFGWQKASIRVILNDGTSVDSPAARWWANPVRTLASGTVAFWKENSNLGAVYVADASTEVNYVSLVNNKDALVVTRNTRLCLLCRLGGNDNAITLYYDDKVRNQHSGTHFHWVEGDFTIWPEPSGNVVDSVTGNLIIQRAGIRVDGAYNVLRQVSVNEGSRATHGIRISSLGTSRTRNNLLQDVRVQLSGGAGIYLDGDDNTLDGVKLGNNGRRATEPWNFQLEEGARAGLYVLGSHNHLTNIWSTGNTGNGVLFDLNKQNPVSQNTLTFSSLSSNRFAGLKIASDENVVMGLTSTNNGGISASDGYSDGIEITGNNNIVRHSTIAANQRYGINLASGKTVSLANTLTTLNKGGNNGVTSTAAPGTSVYVGNTSTANYTFTMIYDGYKDDATSRSPVTTWWDQLSNLSEGWGIQDFTALNDSRVQASDPASANIAACSPTVICARWNWSLKNSATSLFGANVAAPAGGKIINAIEIIDDGIGNDDGQCDAGETCLETPNVGAYQGHGNLTMTPKDDTSGNTYYLLKYNTQGY